MCALT